MAWLAREEAAAEESESAPPRKPNSFLSPPPPNYKPPPDVKTRTEPRSRASPRRVAAATPSSTGLGSNPLGTSTSIVRQASRPGQPMGTPRDAGEINPDENNGMGMGVKGIAAGDIVNGTGNELVDGLGKTTKSWSSVKRVFEL